MSGFAIKLGRQSAYVLCSFAALSAGVLPSCISSASAGETGRTSKNTAEKRSAVESRRETNSSSSSSDAAEVQTESRLPREAIELLTAISDEHSVQRRKVPEQLDRAVIERLVESSDEGVRAIALLAKQRLELQEQFEQQREKVDALVKESAMQMRGSLLMRSFGSFLGGDDAVDVSGLAQDVERAGRKPQLAINDLRKTGKKLLQLRLSVFDQVQELARANANPAADDGPELSVLLSGSKPGYLNIMNRSNQTWHHCILISRTALDASGIQRRAKQEAAFGRQVLPKLGYSDDEKGLAEQSAQGVELRARLVSYDQGSLVYVPEIRGKTAIEMRACDGAPFLRIARDINVSFFADEGTRESQPANNLAAVKRSIQSKQDAAAKKRGQLPKGRATKKTAKAASRNR